MNMRNILAGLGKAMTPADKGRTMATKLGMSPNDNFVLKSGSLSDNEPMMQDRSPANQMFSIDAQIENLMKSYNMLVNAQEFGRAQEVADQIDQLQQQKIGIQAQNDPRMMGSMEDLMRNVPNMPKGKPEMPISNREYISSLLESISE